VPTTSHLVKTVRLSPLEKSRLESMGRINQKCSIRIRPTRLSDVVVVHDVGVDDEADDDEKEDGDGDPQLPLAVVLLAQIAKLHLVYGGRDGGLAGKAPQRRHARRVPFPPAAAVVDSAVRGVGGETVDDVAAIRSDRERGGISTPLVCKERN
jgi:hypothetical protein